MRLKRFNAQKESKRLQNYHNKSNNIKKRTILLSAFILVGSIMLLTYASFSSSIKVDVMHSKVGNLIQDDYEIKAYINNTLSNDIPEKEDGYTVDHVNCTNDAVGIWDDVKWGILITEAEEPTVCSVYFKEYDDINEFDYTGNIQTFTAPRTGTYKLETWGAQGGFNGGTEGKTTGGYGGYSIGTIHLEKDEILYVAVGNEGNSGISNYAYYNGGGVSYQHGGGGSTHIATETGELKDLEEYKGQLSQNEDYYISDVILIVSGGGGGSDAPTGWEDATPENPLIAAGSGGGFKGNDSTFRPGYGGTQIAGGSGYQSGSFGNGGGSLTSGDSGGAGGGGFFGGGSGSVASWSDGGGGSGYIASSRLESNSTVTKHMYCYDCEISNDTETKTESDGTSSCHDEEPTPDCAKEGNGFAKITLLSLD